jgi:hypothetical protein
MLTNISPPEKSPHALLSSSTTESLTIFSEIYSHVPDTWVQNFRTDFLESIVRNLKNPTTLSQLVLRWNPKKYGYDAESIPQWWQQSFPETVTLAKTFVTEINQIQDLNPFNIRIYEYLITKIYLWFAVISLSIMSLLSLASNFLTSDRWCGFEFWGIFI